MSKIVRMSKADETFTVAGEERDIEVTLPFICIERKLYFLKYLKNNNLDVGPIESLTKYIK